MPRVLVVDDNVDSAEMLAEAMGMWGHEVRVAHDGEGALAHLGSFTPDLVLLDISMPGLSGYDVARRIREERGRRLRLYALTGHGLPRDRARVKEAGFDGHLVKPVDLDQLQKLLGPTLS